MDQPDNVSNLYPPSHYQALLKVVTAVSTNLKTPTLLTELAHQLTQTFQVTSVYISDWDPNTGNATILAE